MAVWGGVGTNFDGYSLTIAARYGAFGLGFGYQHNSKEADRLPSFSSAPPPATATGETTFQVSTVGADIYTKTAIADFVDGYGLIGMYVEVNTVLVHDSTGYYESLDSPDWTKPKVAYGAGIEFNPITWLIAGLGYHSIRGLTLHAGVTW